MKATAKRKYTKRPKTALVKKEVSLPAQASAGISAVAMVDPQALLAQAIDKNLPIESMERLLALRDKMKAEWAREQFFTALAGFQRDCPIIGKDRTAKIRSRKGDESSFSYQYAPLETIIKAAQPVLEKWGFSWTCKPEQADGYVKAAVHAHHKDGHEEVTEFSVPLDASSYMSAPQQAAAASTFARRYAFINAFGITTKGEDNDAPGDEEPRKRAPIQEPRAQAQAKDAAIPTTHEEVPDPAKMDDYHKCLWLLKSSATDPKTKVIVRLFTENEIIDYTHQANEAKDKPQELKVILADIIEYGKKKTRIVKGE